MKGLSNTGRRSAISALVAKHSYLRQYSTIDNDIEITLMFSIRRLIRREIRKTVKRAFRATTPSQISQSRVLRGKCYVIDGDTIVINKQKIRFAGIDAPEIHHPYGKQAKFALIEICKGKYINAHLTGETSYDRLVAKCLLDDGTDLAAEMVKKELALDIPHFPNADYKHLETPNTRRKLKWRPNKTAQK